MTLNLVKMVVGARRAAGLFHKLLLIYWNFWNITTMSRVY